MNRDELLDRISIKQEICHGKPCIKGTRIMVYQILDLLASGTTVSEIVSEKYFPDISQEDALACIAFANQFIQSEEILFYEARKAG